MDIPNGTPTRGTVLRRETARTICGVEGRAMNVIADGAGGIANQTWLTSREYREGGRRYRLTVNLRFDDECRNGHSTFAITGDIHAYDAPRWRWESGGCLHDDIAQRFPALAHLIPWHLVSTDGPMHYVANTVYLAGDRDCNGLRAGEVRQIRNGKTGLPSWRLATVNAAGNEIPHPATYVDSATPPDVNARHAYLPWTRTGEGKVRQLDAARQAAVWPDATDAELCAEPEALKAALTARLPIVLERFRAAMAACGFLYPAN